MAQQVCVATTVNVDTAPASEPVTTDEAKTHLRVEHAHEDAYIDTLIEAARVYCETVTRRHFINTTLIQYHDEFPDTIELRHVPVSSITSVEYYDTDDALQTFAASKYNTDIVSEPGRIWLDEGEAWPSTYAKPNTILITFVAGYGSAASSVPAGIKHAIKVMVHHWYWNRAPVGQMSMPIQMTVDALLGNYCWSAVP